MMQTATSSSRLEEVDTNDLGRGEVEEEAEPDPIFEASCLVQYQEEDDDNEDEDDVSSNTEESSPSSYDDDHDIDNTASDVENRAPPSHFSPPKKFLGRLKTQHLQGYVLDGDVDEFQSTEVEDKAMEWSAKLHGMNDRKSQQDTNIIIGDDENDGDIILENEEPNNTADESGNDNDDFDGILEEAWKDVYTKRKQENRLVRVTEEARLGNDFLQGALMLHSEFMTNEHTGYNRFRFNSNPPLFCQSYPQRLSSQDKMNLLHIKYGARSSSKWFHTEQNPLEYRMKSTMAQRNLHLLFEFLAYYLPACYQATALRGNMGNRRLIPQLLLTLPDHQSDTFPTQQERLSLIPCIRTNSHNTCSPIRHRWQPSEELLQGFTFFYLMWMKYEIRLAEQKNQPDRQHIFLQRLLQALEDYKYEKPFDLLLEFANILEALGALNRDHLQDYHQAFVYFTQALDAKSQLCGTEENVELASSLETLGVLARDKLPDQNEVAIRCLKQSLDMKYRVYFEGKDPTIRHRRHDREFLAEEYADVAQTLHSLGLAYDKSAQYEPAREYYEKSLTMKKKQERTCQDVDREGVVANEKFNRQLIATLFNLGCVSNKLLYLDEARSYLEEALRLQYACQNNGGGSKQGLMGTLVQIASIYEKCHETEGSYKYYKAALDIHYQMHQKEPAEACASKSNPLLPVMLSGAANVSNQLGNYEESAFAYESLLDILMKSNSIEERRILIPTLYNLALVNDALGRIEKASKHYRACLDMMNRSPDPHLKDSTEAMSIRTNMLCLPDPFSDDPIPTIPVKSTATAGTAYHKAYEFYIVLMVSKYNHPEYVNQDAAFAITIRNLAMLSSALARSFRDARNYYQQFLEVVWYPHRSKYYSHQAYYNARSIVAVQALYAMGMTERKERNYSDARHYQNEALELLVQTKKQRVQHPDTLTPHQVRLLAILHTAIEREIECLNSTRWCCLLWP